MTCTPASRVMDEVEIVRNRMNVMQKVCSLCSLFVRYFSQKPRHQILVLHPNTRKKGHYYVLLNIHHTLTRVWDWKWVLIRTTFYTDKMAITNVAKYRHSKWRRKKMRRPKNERDCRLEVWLALILTKVALGKKYRFDVLLCDAQLHFTYILFVPLSASRPLYFYLRMKPSRSRFQLLGWCLSCNST